MSLYVVEAHGKFLAEVIREDFLGAVFYPLYTWGWEADINEAFTFDARGKAEKLARKYAPCADVKEVALGLIR